MRPTVKLWEICKFQNWFAFKSELFKSKWQPILRISNIQKDNISDEKLVFFDLKDYDNLDDYIVNPWELVIAMSWATTWKIAINNTDKQYYLNQRVWKFSFDNDITKEYCHYFLWTKVEENLNKAAWAAIQNLSTKQILDIEIPLPPLETQKVIVAKLDQIFAELDQTKSEIQKNLDNTDELWKSALNQAFRGDWEMKKLGEVCEVIAWQSPESDYYNESWEWLPFFQWKTEFTEKYLWEPKKWTTKTTKESLKNDILMSVRAPVWPVNINWFEKICIWRWLCAIRPWNNVKLDYVFNYLLSIQDKISWNRGSVFDSINRNQIESIEIPVPPLSEQEKIVEHLDQVSKEVKALKSQYQSQLDNLEELKKSVLDKAFRWELGE